MKYFDDKTLIQSKIIKQTALTHETITKNILGFLQENPDTSRTKAIEYTLNRVGDELQKLIDIEVRLKSSEMFSLGFTSQDVKNMRQQFYARWLTSYTNNPLFTYEKIKDSYGNVISVIRDSTVRDRLYMSDPISNIQREYINDVFDLFNNNNIIREDIIAKLNANFISRDLSQFGFTIVNSEVMNVYRSQEDIIRQEARLEYGVYYGSVSHNTREFCLQHIGEVLPWQDWVDMENDIGDADITLYAGGYNCRHKVYAVDETLGDEARSELHDVYGEDTQARKEYQNRL